MIFVDTTLFVALLLPKDANHNRAVGTIEELCPPQAVSPRESCLPVTFDSP